MIGRTLETHLRDLATRWPVLTITGPRQSGKTTLSRLAFPDHRYASLESPDTREYAATDPRGFLAEHGEGAIIDEIQRVPELLSYIQTEVDARPEAGRFIVTGSTHLGLLGSVTQSLAGRTAIVHLLACSLDELLRFDNAPSGLYDVLWTGGYPAILDRAYPPQEWFESYITTYIERDVRHVLNVGDLSAFQQFLKLCAGRTGQLPNLSQLGADCGISHNTARSWLSVLETGFISFRLRPHATNLRKREIRTPKLYFYDSGLVCALLGIRSPDQLRHHPLRGAIFEGWVVSEVAKHLLHRGSRPEIAFYRDRRGLEMDVLIRRDTSLIAMEIKSGQTVSSDMLSVFAPLRKRFEESGTEIAKSVLVYGGHDEQRRSDVRVIPWSALHDQDWG
jgi:predicted AAA+ superfamily ATPase